jgi:hypothetical protein
MLGLVNKRGKNMFNQDDFNYIFFGMDKNNEAKNETVTETEKDVQDAAEEPERDE